MENQATETGKKNYRIQHQRCHSDTHAVLLQNRLVAAASAEQALRMVIPKPCHIDVYNSDHAKAEEKRAADHSDLWTAVLADDSEY